jgi:long-subunit acyl-CoA synthetase (AMP-forming)
VAQLQRSTPQVEYKCHYREVMRWWQDRRPLGNRCRMAIVGGATTSPALREFLFRALHLTVVDGYGTTETGGLASNGDLRDSNHVQLIDCPALGYLTSDKPHPRGEVVARTARMTPGYYGEEKATAASFIRLAGVKFFRTGDIGEMTDGHVRIIDRVKSFFKLSQGMCAALCVRMDGCVTCGGSHAVE